MESTRCGPYSIHPRDLLCSWRFFSSLTPPALLIRINVRQYPFLNNKQDYRRDQVLARDVMTRARDITFFSDEGWTLGRIEAVLEAEEYRGFPIVRTIQDRVVLGYIARLELLAALETIRQSPEVGDNTPCYFTDSPTRAGRITIEGSPRPYFSPEPSRPTGHAFAQPYSEIGAETGPAQPRQGHARARSSISVGLGASQSFSALSGGPIFEEPDDLPRGGAAGAKEAAGGGTGAGAPWVNLQPWVDEIPITLSQDTPMEVVVQMYGRLGLRFMLFTRRGALTGILTKMDLHAHLQPREDVSVQAGRRSKRREGEGGGVKRRTAGAGEGEREEIGLLERAGGAS